MSKAHAVLTPRWTVFADDSATPLSAAAEGAAEGESTDFVIPEDVSVLSDEDLTALRDEAVANFDALYDEAGDSPASDVLEALGVLTEGIERLNGEKAARDASAAERKQAADELAKRVKGTDVEAVEEDDEDDEEDDEEEMSASEDDDDDETEVVKGKKKDDDGIPAGEVPVEAVAASAAPAREIRVSLSGLGRSRRTPAPPTSSDRRTPSRMRDVVLASGEGSGYEAGTGLDWADVGRIVDRRLTGFPEKAYQAAHRAGRHMRQTFGVATLHKPFTDELMVKSNDPMHVDEVIRHAMDESRLPGGSLVASGGWCAPSETIYDLCELESRDGLFSLPEVGIARGGINYTKGPDFRDIFAAADAHFSFTEAEDIAGDYDGAGGGSKPCYTVDCPPFEEERLNLDGVCISAGLLQQRGYPEVIARTTRGVLVAHDHKMAASQIAAVVAGSDAVTMTADQVGATAPLLDSIELQVEHFRYVHRLARSVTLEAVFPFWVRGVVRSDLARRNGVELLSVTDSQIDAWFTLRGIAPQYVYNWQDITGDASAFVAWPSTVDFLLYTAGTWVKGTADVISLDTIYDSVNLGTNDFTALFTEEGWLVMKTCHDSRVVTAPLSPTGMTGAGVGIEADGTLSPAV